MRKLLISSIICMLLSTGVALSAEAKIVCKDPGNGKAVITSGFTGVETGRKGNYAFILCTVTIRNNSMQSLSYCSFGVTVKDRDGLVLGTGRAGVGDLKPGNTKDSVVSMGDIADVRPEDIRFPTTIEWELRNTR